MMTGTPILQTVNLRKIIGREIMSQRPSMG